MIPVADILSRLQSILIAFNTVCKAKKYLAGNEKDPKGKKVFTGPREGRFYITGEIAHPPGNSDKYATPLKRGEKGHIKKKQIPKFRPAYGGLHHHTKSGVHGPGTYVITKERGTQTHHLHFFDGDNRIYLGKSDQGAKPLKKRVKEFKLGRHVIPKDVKPDEYQDLVRTLTPRHYSHVMKVADLAVDMVHRSGNARLNVHHVRDSAMLHDIGKDVNPERHGKIAEKYIKEGDLIKDLAEQKIVGKVVAEHGGCHQVSCGGFQDNDCNELKAMIPVIRIADALSRSGEDHNPVRFDTSGRMVLHKLDLTNLDKRRKDRIRCNADLYNRYLSSSGHGVPIPA